MNKTPEERAKALLEKLSLEEKIYQVVGDMIFDVDENYDEKRNPLCGSYRNPGHFIHNSRGKVVSPAEVTKRINADVENSINAQPHHIPPIENGEALHGAQWGMGTNFPQPIGLASSFDPELVEKVGDAIGKECAAVGVRQVFSPVVNLVRDCRWGRTVETYGEDVKLTSDMGAAMCRGLEKNGVIATPKHFADNYSYGGRDSNYSETSERTMRETILPPFKACFDAGAKSVMAAYNGWDGIPCSANRRLLTDILRKEWGFDGFVVSDYGGVDGLKKAQRLTDGEHKAAAMALKAGLDVILPFNKYETVREALESGCLTEEELDKNVLRVLTAKFRLGLFDEPYKDPGEAEKIVRCKEHRKLALEAARESIILLKNDDILPLDRKKIKRIGVFGQSADLIPIGANYSGPYNFPWRGDDAPTPLEALRKYLDFDVDVIRSETTGDIETIGKMCDVNLYFTSIIEGEGKDRSKLKLPNITSHKSKKDNGGFIVDDGSQSINENQEEAILRLHDTGKPLIVILQNGAPIEMTSWEYAAKGILESWYPGEQGGRALAEILFGEVNPSARLPITIPKSVGQLPLFYSVKPSGRGYAYCDDNGMPLYTFGYGLSYTDFEAKITGCEAEKNRVRLSCEVKNTGEREGTQVLQIYLFSENCEVLRPLAELIGYKRVNLKPGESKEAVFTFDEKTFSFYDAQMNYGLHNGEHTLMAAFSCLDVKCTTRVFAVNGKLIPG